MSNKAYAHTHLAMYFVDFETEVRRIDSFIFSPIARPHCTVRAIEELESSSDFAQHTKAIACFTTFAPKSDSGASNVLILPIQTESYLLLKWRIAQRIEAVFRQGQGDAWLKKQWFRSALALVRSRVVFRSQWFPGVALRNCETIRRYASLFGKTVFADISHLPAMLRNGKHFTSLEIDMRLTQLLIDATLENGADESEALTLLTTD